MRGGFGVLDRWSVVLRCWGVGCVGCRATCAAIAVRC